jgi:hypothetical protein
MGFNWKVVSYSVDQGIPFFYGTRKFIITFTKSLPLVTMNPVHTLKSNFLKIIFSTIIQYNQSIYTL